MNKKIIAVALALLVMAAAFTGCKKDYEIRKIQGKEFPIAVDDDGNTIIDDQNRVAFYVTDEHGDIEEDEDGEPMTNWVQVYNQFVTDDEVNTPAFSMTKIDGWEFSEVGVLRKKKTDNKCYIQCVKVCDIKEESDKEEAMNMEIYLANVDKTNKETITALRAEGYAIDYIEDTVTLTMNRIPAEYRKFMIYSLDGDLISYSEGYYFERGEEVYKLDYTCLDGVGYDEDFDFEAFTNTNFVIKK